MLKVIVAGTRTFSSGSNYFALKEVMKKHNFISQEVEIVSGGCRGADALGERWAREYGKPIKLFPADWDKYGRKAGFIRNKEMAEYGDCLVAFWDGTSRGTKMMIDLAKAYGLKVFVYRY